MKRIFALLILLAFTSLANAQAPSSENSRVPPATQLTVPVQLPTNIWTLGKPVLPTGNFEILRNGKLAGAGGSLLVLCQGSVYTKGRDNAFWRVVREDSASVVWERLSSKIPCDAVTLTAVTLTGTLPKPIEIKTAGKVTVVRRPVDSGDVVIKVNDDLSVEALVNKNDQVMTVKP